MLASLDIDGLRPPARFAEPTFAPQRAVWLALMPRLKLLARASVEYQAPLAAFCDAVVRYTRAVVELEEKGYTSEVATVAGGTMLRVNPAEKVRQQALAEILALSERFGFTPRDNWSLMLDQRKLVDPMARQHGLFGRDAPPADEPPPRSDPLGDMDAFDSEPPGRMN